MNIICRARQISTIFLYQFARRVVKPPPKQLSISNESIAELIKKGKSDEQILALMISEESKQSSNGQPQLPEKPKKNVPQIDPNLRHLVQERARDAVAKEEEDKSFKQLAEQDQDESKKKLDIYVERPKRGDKVVPRKRDKFEPDSFEKMKELKIKLYEKFEPQDEEEKKFVDNLVKEELFRQKKESEEIALFEAKRKTEERRKELREATRKFNKVEWDEDEDLGKSNQMIKQDLKKLNFDDKVDRVEQLNKEYREKLEKTKDYYFYQRTRTSNNMDLFLEKFLCEQKRDLEKVCPQYPIRIVETFTNESSSVMWVFWELMDDLDKEFFNRPALTQIYEEYNKKIKEREEFQKKVNDKLNKYSGYLSGKMCQALRLKYGPDIRFKPSKMHTKTQAIREDFQENIEDVVNQELQDKYKQGLISREITRKQYNKVNFSIF